MFLPFFGFPFVQKLQKWAHPAFFDYQLPVTVAAVGEGDQLRGRVGLVLRRAHVEDDDLLPDETRVKMSREREEEK